MMRAGQVESQNRHFKQVQQSQILAGDDVLCEREVENEKEDNHALKPFYCLRQDLSTEWQAATSALNFSKAIRSSGAKSRTLFLDLRSLRI